MPEYIDREVLLKKIFPLGVLTDLRYTINAQAVRYAIEGCKKEDVVPVVKCKDCKHYKKINYDDVKPNTCERTTMRQLPYDFCSYGERKDSNG